MEDKKIHIDKLYREELGDYTEQPSPAAWQSLSSRLDADKIGTPAFSWNTWLWRILALIVLSGILYFAAKSTIDHYSKHPAANKTNQAPAAPANPYPASAIADNTQQNDAAEKDNTTTHTAAETTQPTQQKTQAPQKEQTQNPDNTNTTTAATNQPAQQKTHTTKNNQQTTPKQKAQNPDHTTNTTAAANQPAQQKTHTTKNNQQTTPKQQAQNPDHTNNTTAAANQLAQQKTHTTKNNQQKTPKQQAQNPDYTNNTTAAANQPAQQKTHTTKNNQQKTPKQKAQTPDHTNNTTAANQPAQQKTHTTKNNQQKTPKQKAQTPDNTTNHTAAAPGQQSITPAGNTPVAKKPNSSKKTSGKKQHTQPQQDEQPIAAGTLPNYTMPPIAPNGKPLTKNNKTPRSQRNAEPPNDRNKIPDYLRVDTHEKWNEAGNNNTAKNEDDSKEEAGSGGGAGGGDTATPPDKKKKLQLGFGIKAGYEMGSGTYHANSYVVSPYIELSLTNNISLICQPAFKYARLNNTKLDDTRSYYNIKGGTLDSAHQLIQTGFDSLNIPVYDIKRRYYYTQTHDSVVVSTSIASKTYYEYELPLLLQYKLTKGVNLYLGASANFSKIVQIAEQKTTYSNINRYDSLIFAPVGEKAPAPAVPSVDSRFSYNYPSLSGYTPGAVQNATSNPVRFNYIIGMNLTVWHRLMADVLVQGMLSDAGYIPDTRIRNIYRQPHVRITLGYRLGK